MWAAQQSDVIILNNPLDNIVTDGLVLCLDANFTCSYPKASTTWYDLSGNGNDGSLVNGPTFDSGNGGSIVFDGTNDSITSTAPLSSGEDTYTIESFWKTDELKTQVIWEQNTSTLQIGTRVCMILLNRGVGGFNGQNADFHSSVPYSINTWYHWVITVDNTLSTNKVKVYVNGNLYAQGNPSNTLNTGADSAAIGHKIPSSSEEFNGDISIVRVYNKTLSSDEVLQNFNAQKARFGL